jgi:nicotinate dehydrogenase subunit B
MSNQPVPNLVPEVERYEWFAPPAYQFELDRREFVKLIGGGLLVMCLAPEEMAQGQLNRGGRGRGNLPADVSAWLRIGEDGKVTVYTGKVELGQNIRTSLTQAVAEELRAPVSSIQVVMADTSQTPFDMGTFGSMTTPTMAAQLHRAAAAARELLIDMAAQHWQTDRAGLSAGEGKISDARNQRSIDYGQLTRGKKLVRTIGSDVAVRPPSQWHVAGQSIAKVDGRDIVTGKHRYSSDVKRPGMLHGKVLRPPAFGATLTRVDTQAAQALAGVVVVHDGDFVGVAAPDEQQAQRALDTIQAEWKTVPQPSARELFEYLRKNRPEGQGRRARGERAGGGRGSLNQGSIHEGLQQADEKLQATYTVAYIAHAPLETRAGVAEWDQGKLTVWTGTQRPFGVREDLARSLNMSPGQVRVIVPDTGSGYGGKHTSEAALEAARLARAAGKPVKVAWTREEEFSWAYFRPAGVIDIQSGVQKDGKLIAWECHNYNSGGSALASPYDVPNHHAQFHGADSPLRQGSYRALAATANHFARETHMDELAHRLRLDPLAFRLQNLKDPRLRAVLETAAKQFGWGEKAKEGHGFGLAVGTEKRSYVASCAEVAVDRSNGRVKVVRVVTAFDCGAVVNPEHLKNQVEGAVVMGLGGALFEAIDFANGQILNPRFSSYRVPRFRDLPELQTTLIDRKDVPSAGAGETPIVCVAPAVGDAIFAASGVRLRSMPLVPNRLKT